MARHLIPRHIAIDPNRIGQDFDTDYYENQKDTMHVGGKYVYPTALGMATNEVSQVAATPHHRHRAQMQSFAYRERRADLERLGEEEAQQKETELRKEKDSRRKTKMLQDARARSKEMLTPKKKIAKKTKTKKKG